MARIEKTVFISYRRNDVYSALAVYENLKIQGYDVFFDYLSIASGDFEQIITSNIKARAHFLLILTPTALDRCNEPGDWLRREIEIAMDEKRNIVPLFFKGFRFGVPSVIEKLTGKLKNLSHYNGLNVHEDYFDEAMERVRKQYLNIPLSTVLHPVSTEVQKVVREDQFAADKALEQIDIKELVKQTDEKPIQLTKPNPMHESKASVLVRSPNFFRLIGGLASVVFMLALLVLGGARLFDVLLPLTPEESPTAQFPMTQTPLPALTNTLLPTHTPPPTKTYTLTPTSTRVPTRTRPIPSTPATSTISCYGLAFVSDVTIPDNTRMTAGQAFTKTWMVKNTGSCTWNAGFKFAFIGGDSMGGTTYTLPSPVSAGEEYNISIPMIVPNTTGAIRGNWRMSTSNDLFFGTDVWVIIVVGVPVPVVTTVSPPGILISGHLDIPEGGQADLDRGMVTHIGADILFGAFAPNDRFIDPQIGSRGAIYGASVDPPGLEGCMSRNLTSDRFRVDNSNFLPGTYVCVVTDENHYAQFKVTDNIGPSPGVLRIDYTTWSQ